MLIKGLSVISLNILFKDKYPEIPLIYSIIGDGEELYEIKNYIHMQKLESTIHTYGRLPYSELKPFLDTHNIGISYRAFAKSEIVSLMSIPLLE